MKKRVLALTLIALGVTVYEWRSLASDEPSTDAPQLQNSATQQAIASEPVVGTPPLSPAPNTLSTAKTHTSTARVPVAASGFAEPALRRRVADTTPVRVNDRDWQILGTRELPGSDGKAEMLILRDLQSGQLDYRQSALRFVLVDGQDYETFIRARMNAARLFVNSLYGDIAVDATRIGQEYTELLRDPRVKTLMFIPLEIRPVPK